MARKNVKKTERHFIVSSNAYSVTGYNYATKEEAIKEAAKYMIPGSGYRQLTVYEAIAIVKPKALPVEVETLELTSATLSKTKDAYRSECEEDCDLF